MREFVRRDNAADPQQDVRRVPADAAVDSPVAAGRIKPWRDFSAVPTHTSASSARIAGAVAEGLSAPAQPVDPATRRSMEARLGEPLGAVRLHTGWAARRSAAALDARAFTVGEHVVFGRDADRSDVRGGVLGHELTHVLQNRRGGSSFRPDRLAPEGGAAEREAGRNASLSRLGLPSPRTRATGVGVARTPTSNTVTSLISYGLTDWEVTPAEEVQALDALAADPDLSATVADIARAGMLAALFDRIEEPANRRRLVQLLGANLNPAGRALVEPHIIRYGQDAELQYNLGRLGVTSAAAPFDPAPLESALVGTTRTGSMGHTGGHLTQPFTGVGATGVIPITRYVGTFYSTPGVAQIPVTDQALLAAGHAGTVATYSNPISANPTGPSLAGYLATLSATQRSQQAELLLRRPIASARASSYAGSLPSRAQVIRAAASAHNLHPELVAAFILAEQRDQSQAEDAKDYQGATSLLRGNTSIGLGQVVVSTARRHDLFADLLSTTTRTQYGLSSLTRAGHETTAGLLASDEFNIFAVARYIRRIANQGATLSLASLPRTAAQWPGLDLSAYAGPSTSWPDDNIRALGSEYTSVAWDDGLVTDWADFVWEAYQDVRASRVF